MGGHTAVDMAVMASKFQGTMRQIVGVGLPELLDGQDPLLTLRISLLSEEGSHPCISPPISSRAEHITHLHTH